MPWPDISRKANVHTHASTASVITRKHDNPPPKPKIPQNRPPAKDHQLPDRFFWRSPPFYLLSQDFTQHVGGFPRHRSQHHRQHLPAEDFRSGQGKKNRRHRNHRFNCRGNRYLPSPDRPDFFHVQRDFRVRVNLHSIFYRKPASPNIS